MPAAIPVVMGAIGVSSGLAAFGAAATTFAAVSAGAMIAGGAMLAIGGVSGSKKMQKFGGIIGLAGGVGTLASHLAADTVTQEVGKKVAEKAGGKAVTNAGATSVAQDVSNPSVTGASAVSKTSGDFLSSAANPSINSPSSLQLGSSDPLKLGGPSFSSIANANPTINDPSFLKLAPDLPTPPIQSPSPLDSLEKNLAKYKEITKIAGYAGQGYETYAGNQIANNYYNRRQDLADRKYKDQYNNVNAKFNVNMRAKPYQPGMLYQGIKQNPVPVRQPQYGA